MCTRWTVLWMHSFHVRSQGSSPHPIHLVSERVVLRKNRMSTFIINLASKCVQTMSRKSNQGSARTKMCCDFIAEKKLLGAESAPGSLRVNLHSLCHLDTSVFSNIARMVQSGYHGSSFNISEDLKGHSRRLKACL